MVCWRNGVTMYRIVVAVDEDNNIGSLEDAEKLLFIDLDTGYSFSVDNPLKKGLTHLLEELIEEYSPVIMFCRNAGDQVKDFFEENGVKVVTTSLNSIDELLSYVRG